MYKYDTLANIFAYICIGSSGCATGAPDRAGPGRAGPGRTGPSQMNGVGNRTIREGHGAFGLRVKYWSNTGQTVMITGQTNGDSTPLVKTDVLDGSTGGHVLAGRLHF